MFFWSILFAVCHVNQCLPISWRFTWTYSSLSYFGAGIEHAENIIATISIIIALYSFTAKKELCTEDTISVI